MLYLLDTSALLAHYRQETGWQAVQALFEDQDAKLLIASPSLTELGRRLFDLGASQENVAETLTAYRQLFPDIVPVNDEVAMQALEIIRQTPRRLPLIDALIAAAAFARDATLVHRDEHMRSLPAGRPQRFDLQN